MVILFILLSSFLSFAEADFYIVNARTKYLPDGPDCKASEKVLRFQCAQASIENKSSTVFKSYEPYKDGKPLPRGFSKGPMVSGPIFKYLNLSKEKLKTMGLTPEMICTGIQWTRFGAEIPCPKSGDFSVWWENEGGQEAICKMTIDVPNGDQNAADMMSYCGKKKAASKAESIDPSANEIAN